MQAGKQRAHLDLHGKGLQLVGEVLVLALALAGQHLEIPPRLLQLLVARHHLPQHLLQLCLRRGGEAVRERMLHHM